MGKYIETFRAVVYPWHCDHIGHMNVMWYVGKFDEATWCFMTDLGLTPSLLRAEGRGMAAVKQEISYARELLAGDVVTVTFGMAWKGRTRARPGALRLRPPRHQARCPRLT